MQFPFCVLRCFQKHYSPKFLYAVLCLTLCYLDTLRWCKELSKEILQLNFRVLSVTGLWAVKVPSLVVGRTLIYLLSGNSAFVTTFTSNELGWYTKSALMGAVCQTFGKCKMKGNMRIIELNGSSGAN